MPTSHPRPWRRGSLFSNGPRRVLDREQRARFRFLLRAHTRGGRLSPMGEWVGEALVKRLGADGQCDPSHETLAGDAGCSARTVRRATATMRSLGLLRWHNRLVRAGWRAEQTSNAYELVPTGDTPAPRCGGQIVRQTLRKDISPIQQVTHTTPEEVRAAKAALARRRAVIEESLLNKGRSPSAVSLSRPDDE